jgi:hypothetical protein
MPKRTTPPNPKFPNPSDASVGAAEEAKAYRDETEPKVGRGEAIRRRFATLGGVELEPFPDAVLAEPRPAPRKSRRK